MGERHDIYLQTSRFGLLDGLRFVAIVAVLFHHSPGSSSLQESNTIFLRGFLGVDLFFVISGFLITTLLLRERRRTGRISLAGFYRRRALRILPLYLLVVTAIGAYYVFVERLEGTVALWPFYYLFLANFLSEDIPLLSPMWSLAVEEQYYLLWPLLVLLVPRRLLPAVLGTMIALNAAILLGAFGRWSLELRPLVFTETSFPYVAILLGSALALTLDSARGFAMLHPILGARWAAAGWSTVLLILLFVLPDRLAPSHDLLIHATMAALVGSIVIREDSVVAPVLRLRGVVRIGMVSYGIYLLHLPALDVAMRLASMFDRPVDGLFCNVVYVALSIALAEVSFRFFETIFLNMRHKQKAMPTAARP